MKPAALTRFFKTLGPGILFASTAIGVSHLVQSTRAGADYGFALIGFVIAANLFKYPFFEYGSRYASATGESIIDGYARIGRWMLLVYAAITVVSMFLVTSAVGAVTSGFLQNLFGISSWGMNATAILFAVCVGLLLMGSYRALDTLVKVIGAVLLISTLIAFGLALHLGPETMAEGFVAPGIWDESGILFIIALMGWMPTAVDLSAWNSLWTIERIRQTGYRPTLKETLADFNFGYLVSALLALCFVTLGTYMLYGTGIELPQGSAGFASAVVGIYTNYIGEWSHIIIAASAFSIMFGTCIAVFDGYARSSQRIFELLFLGKDANSRIIYNSTLLITACGAFAVIAFFSDRMRELVDLATTVSFLVAPVIAVVNFRLVLGRMIPLEKRPPVWLQMLSWIGIMFLTGFAIYYLYVRFIGL
ncbi:MAG: divalent metal cation transporter [Flavobacteriales bacterium]|nr:divalent metal cation transporter [Flavobacteriales bacterium]